MLECSPDDVYLAGSPRHTPQLLAHARPHQNSKTHSAKRADRGFLHGWLCDAKRHPKPFTMHEHDVIAGAVATHDVAVVFDI